jgi:type II secretory pathway pseudopilin PulG
MPYKNRQKGFTYPVMLVMVATTGVMAGLANQYTSHCITREKEKELLFRGQQYVQAIEQYYQSGTRRQLPSNFSDLVQDPRFRNRKHLRNIYRDPFFLGDDDLHQGWTVLYNKQQKIMGVASASGRMPIKQVGFSKKNISFNGAQKYSDWKFIFKPELKRRRRVLHRIKNVE